jgi:hypothetical protein
VCVGGGGAPSTSVALQGISQCWRSEVELYVWVHGMVTGRHIHVSVADSWFLLWPEGISVSAAQGPDHNLDQVRPHMYSMNPSNMASPGMCTGLLVQHKSIVYSM